MQLYEVDDFDEKHSVPRGSGTEWLRMMQDDFPNGVGASAA